MFVIIPQNINRTMKRIDITNPFEIGSPFVTE